MDEDPKAHAVLDDQSRRVGHRKIARCSKCQRKRGMELQGVKNTDGRYTPAWVCCVCGEPERQSIDLRGK